MGSLRWAKGREDVSESEAREPTVKRWRRHNARGGSRPHRLELKLTDEEYVRVSAEAQVRQCSRQAVLMRALTADGAEAARRLREIEADLLSARRGVARVSGNLNQAVKLEHTRRLEGPSVGSEFEQDMRRVLGEVETVLQEMRAVLERIAE